MPRTSSSSFRRRTYQKLGRTLRNLSLLSLLVACGSRTGLFGDGDDLLDGDLDVDGGRSDASREGGSGDASVDRNVAPDAIPPLDATPRDANRTDCQDAAQTLVYVMSSDNQLASFDPSAGTFKTIGTIACPTTGSGAPFSMAVDRKGVAYTVFSDRTGVDEGKLFRVSTATAACVGTTFLPRQAGFQKFGMGFAANLVGTGESLFIASSEQSDLVESRLGRIIIPSFALATVGTFKPSIAQAELTGTGDGRLYGLYTKSPTLRTPVFIGEIDPTTGAVIGENQIPGANLGNAWAFAAWGGDFYLFTAPADATQVTRYRPSDGSVRVIASTSLKVVGAGVSTCAPSE